MVNFFGSDDDERKDEQLATKGEKESMRVTRESGWYADLKNNARKIVFGIGSFIIVLLAWLNGWTWLGLGVLAFAASSIFGYFFWQRIISVPMTAVIETDNKKRIIHMTLIPDALLPEFEIEGVKQYFYDEYGTPVLVADGFSLEDRFIKCAYSHNVSNLELAVNQEALDDAKDGALDILRENAELKKNLDLAVERRLKGIEDGIRKQVDKDLLGEGEEKLTKEEVEEIVG